MFIPTSSLQVAMGLGYTPLRKIRLVKITYV